MQIEDRNVVQIFFFFQAEDGIRDLYVTGVQTCALPISCRSCGSSIPVSTNVWLNVRKAATVSNERLSFWMSKKRGYVTPKLEPRCAEKSEMATICFASPYGGGRNKTAFTTENAAVPIPMAK